MRKIALVDYGKLEMQDDWAGIPAAQPGTVKVEVSACAICGSDLALFRGKRDLKSELYFGHEFSGRVVEAGPGSYDMPVGARVASEVSRACGHCWYCRNGLPSLCKSMNDAFLPGGFSEETNVLCDKENSFLTKIPDTLDDITATLLEPTNCSLQVALKANIKPGEKVAVIGMGPMGFITARIIQSLGAGLVVGIVNKPSRLAQLNEIGFLEGIDSSEENWTDQVKDFFGPFGPDVVVELSGNLVAFQNALNIVRPGGRIVVGSVYTGFASNVELRPVMRKELTIVGAKGPYPNLNSDGTSTSMVVLNQLQGDLRKLIHVYDYKDAVRAFEDTMTSKSIKSVILFNR